MAIQSLNLPINIPWKLIAVSEDMMDTQFCDKELPLEWKSSLAISAFEPLAEDLPEGFCEGQLSYLKVTCSITGFQPTTAETQKAFDNFTVLKPEDLDGILRPYWACYGVLLNVSVFPFPETRLEFEEHVRIAFAQLEYAGVGAVLPNPYTHPTGIAFEAPGQSDNVIVDIYPSPGDGNGELAVRGKLIIIFPAIPEIAAVEATIVHYGSPGITMEAFSGEVLVGMSTTDAEPGQPHRLRVEGKKIERIVLTASTERASLLELACFLGKEVRVELPDFPHFISFEPKTRDLYQAGTESGEVLTASLSRVNTDKTFAHTETSQTTMSASATAGVGKKNAANASLTSGLSHTWGETDQVSQAIQTDASRERRETQATSTSISQLYNLLSGYHQGTNRATFLMLARPHVLQPTDHRTFIQGLRCCEGVQEFFLVVARPKGIKGLSIEAHLETGHFPENAQVDEVPPVFEKRVEQFLVTAQSRTDESRSIEEFLLSNYTVESGWVIDRAEPTADPFHQGIKFLGGADDEGDIKPGDFGPNGNLITNEKARLAMFNYQAVGDSTVQVVGRVIKPTDPSPENRARQVGLRFQVFTRSEKPKTDSTRRVRVDELLITARKLCVRMKSGACPEVVEIPTSPPLSIVDEYPVELAANLLTKEETAPTRLNFGKTRVERVENSEEIGVTEVSPTLLTRDDAERTRLPALKDLLRTVQSTMASSARLPSRLPLGQVGFLDTDYFKNRLMQVAVFNAKLADVTDLSPAVLNAFDPDAKVRDALMPSLSTLAKMTGLSIAAAVKERFKLLTTAKPLQEG